MPNKKSVTVNSHPEATITETNRLVKRITHPEQAERGLRGHLNYEGRQILVVRGADAAAITAQVFFKFAAELDFCGKPFQMSLKKRGLIHSHPTWKSLAKITGEEMLAYLNRWFVPFQLVTNPNGKALLLLDGGIPATFAGLCMQPRYLAMFGDLFPTVE